MTSKWLENARAVAVPDVISAKTANKTPFGTNDTFGTHAEDQNADAFAAFEERAAMSEYDGGLPRSHAELIAAACVVPLAAGETLEHREATIIHFAEHLDRLRRPIRKAGAR